jgi:DNA topoisomerase-1
LPKKLGETADGEPITVAIGQFGPYVKYGAKYVSLKEDDPYKVTLERAIEVIAAKKVADANRIIHDFGVDDIQVLNGRYGPYITDKQRNARIPKDRDPKTLTLDDCRVLLAAAPIRPARGRFGRRGAAAKGKKVAVVAPVVAAAAEGAPKAKARAKRKVAADKALPTAAPQLSAAPGTKTKASAKTSTSLPKAPIKAKAKAASRKRA